MNQSQHANIVRQTRLLVNTLWNISSEKQLARYVRKTLSFREVRYLSGLTHLNEYRRSWTAATGSTTASELRKSYLSLDWHGLVHHRIQLEPVTYNLTITHIGAQIVGGIPQAFFKVGRVGGHRDLDNGR